MLKSEALIDWQQDANVIERTIRAFNPFPVCQAAFNGTLLKVWQASVVQHASGVAGEILAIDKHGITIACGKQALRLESLQRPGGKPQAAGQLAQSMGLK